MAKMNWDKINRAKPGVSYGGPVVSSASNKPDIRPICSFYTVSQKKNRRICKGRVSTNLGDDENFCEGHQGYVLHSVERGWFPGPQMKRDERKQRAAQKEQSEHAKQERMLEHHMVRRRRK